MSFHDNCSEKKSLSGVKLKKILLESADTKMAVIEAEVEGSSDPAVIVLNKLPFTEKELNGMLSDSTAIQNEMQNDIYGQYWLKPDPEDNPVKANIIHPATQKHIEKYTRSPIHLIHETEHLYLSVTLPFIEQEQFSLDWVYNILDHKKEAERIIYENPDPNHGFLMAPDFKWTGAQIEDLYVLAIVHRKGIKSLRDLNSSHLPLLYNLRDQGLAAIQDKYGLASDKIRCYIHYQPSYYHLHVHFTALEYQAPGINCEKSHLLSDVISNIEKNGSYYQTTVLSFCVNEKSKLYKAYLDNGYFQKKEEKNFVEEEFESGSCDKVLEFFEMIGKAKHEPSGEQWETTYGESAWRMAILSLCLPQTVNRLRLMKLSLVSSFSGLGASNDENTEWQSKCIEVKQILESHLPARVAGELFSLFTEHVNIRRGRLNGSTEHTMYRELLELEEVLLRWEEEGKGRKDLPGTEAILSRMVKLQFPGALRYAYHKDNSELSKFLEFVLKISELQRLKRTGWVKCQVRDPETVAGHMFRMGIMGLMFSHSPQNLKSNQGLLGSNAEAANICICHDMAECIIGDITPHCKVSVEDKAEREMKAFKELTMHLPEHIGLDLFIPFTRYENQEEGDMNAIITKDYDKFDMILQAFEYEKKEKRGPFLQQFFDSTMTAFKSKAVKKWQKSLLETRTNYFSKE
eukprot:TRINITY_DN9748_c0_g1_i13.p1 TRINITY_DN9748_c0_g1~~TRINITY_DN9748_c0_g1_i13.p1  ORF type:complete len:705 (-),score=118.84 TRINITY_DN9748_c0_g1_i13:132-2192(-)